LGPEEVGVDTIEMQPVGVVRGGRGEAVDDDWGASEATIVLDAARFTSDVVAGLDAFSHLEVVYLFHLVAPDDVNLGARHPRGRTDWPEVGIFAQRAKARPNRIGVTTCELLGVDRLDLRVRGLDAIDGTPVLDVKPYMVEFAPRGDVREPEWARELMAHYWKS
jgi:tRNA-Thr(GGU) m(6)t(6)A37 methyltransferase TsaA